MVLKYIFFLFIISFQSYGQSVSKPINYEEIVELRLKSNDQTKDFKERLQLANDALRLSEKEAIDSSVISDYKNISLLYLNSGNYRMYRDFSYKGLRLGKR